VVPRHHRFDLLVLLLFRAQDSGTEDLVRTRISDEYAGSTKMTAHLDHIRHSKATPCTNWSNMGKPRVHYTYSPGLDLEREFFIDNLLV